MTTPSFKSLWEAPQSTTLPALPSSAPLHSLPWPLTSSLSTSPLSDSGSRRRATGDQTDVGFEVDLDRKTAVVNGNGELLLDDTVDYLAATITIIGVPPLDAVIIAPDTGDEGRPVPFDASQSDGDIVTYDWDFGDGQTANFAIGDHVYGDDGAYTVTLVITDSSGATGATHQITINNVAPVITELTADPQVFAEGGNSIIAVSADDVAADLPLGYLFDCNNDGFFEVEQTGDSSTVCSFPDGSIHTVLVQVQDKDGGVTSGDVTVTVANVAPAVSAVGAQTVNEGTPLDLDPIATFTDPGILDTHTATISWGDGTVDVGAVSEAGGSGTVAGSHTYAASGDYTVIVSVTDDDAGTGQDTLTVSVVSEVAEDQWDASLVITANSPDVSLNSGIGTLTFGIHPDAQDTGDPELDEEVPPNPPQPYATFYFDYPDNGPGFRKLFTSRISPPVTVRDIQKWPLRIEVLLVSPVTSPDGVDVNVNIDWNLDGVPSSFITAILFDGGSEPANQVSSMGGPGPYTLTIHIPQGGIIAFRDLTVAVSRSHVQAMVLYDQWNMAALTVEPDSRNKDAILTDVVGASVITWDPLARTYVVANELLPGNGYWIKAIGDSIQLIPGDPIEENVRGAAP